MVDALYWSARGPMPKVQNSEHFPLPSETEKNAGESMLMMWLLADQGTIPKGHPQNFRGFGPPPPLSEFFIDV